MTYREILSNIRIIISDTKRVEYSDDELLNYLKDNIEFLSASLAILQSPYTREKTNVTTSMIETPESFLAADKVDENVQIFSDYIEFENIPCEFIYYKRLPLPNINNLDEESPIPLEFIAALKESTAKRALIRNEYSSTEEEKIKTQLYQAVAQLSRRRAGVIKSARRNLKYEV